MSFIYTGSYPVRAALVNPMEKPPQAYEMVFVRESCFSEPVILTADDPMMGTKIVARKVDSEDYGSHLFLAPDITLPPSLTEDLVTQIKKARVSVWMDDEQIIRNFPAKYFMHQPGKLAPGAIWCTRESLDNLALFHAVELDNGEGEVAVSSEALGVFCPNGLQIETNVFSLPRVNLEIKIGAVCGYYEATGVTK